MGLGSMTQRIRQKVLDHQAPSDTGIAAPSSAPAPAPAPQPFQREQFRDELMGASNAYDVLGRYGIQTDQAGRGTLPTGETLDMVQGAKAGGTKPGWTSVAGGGQKIGQAAGYGDSGGSSGGGSSSSGGFGDARSLLFAELAKMAGPSSASDPVIAAQVDAYRREKQRAGQDERAALAERSAQSGLLTGGASSGAFDAGVGSIHENIGEDVGQFSAGLVGQEVTQRRDQLRALLGMALQMGDNEMARDLQMQIAQMDTQLRQSMFESDDAYRKDRAAEDDFRYGVGLYS